jgi:hypothetical protein
MAERSAQQPPPQPPPQPRPEGTPPQPSLGPAGPPGPEGRTEQGTRPQPGIGGAVEPGQPTEGAGLPTADERTEQARRGSQEKQAPQMNQSHNVQVGDKVQLNGTLFNVASGQYDWMCKGPDGETVPLTNPTMPGPSFTAEQAGAYVTKLTTDDGVATITVNAAEADASTQPGVQGQTVEQRRQLEAQRQQEAERQAQERQQSQARPGETEAQRQERVRQEQERQRQEAARQAQE